MDAGLKARTCDSPEAQLNEAVHRVGEPSMEPGFCERSVSCLLLFLSQVCVLEKPETRRADQIFSLWLLPVR